MNVEIPECMGFLFEPARYKVAYGGRAGVKSWSFARALLVQGIEKPLRIPCGRETMKSIAESVHQLLEDQINVLGMREHYEVLRSEIRGRRLWPAGNRTRFSYHSLRDQSSHNIKSLEGADRFWAEEAQTISRKSWSIVIPTIRKPGSEIWASFNPLLDTDDSYVRFVVNTPPGAVVRKTGWQDNPFLSDEIKRDIEHMRETDPQEYEHVYGGACKQVVDGAIYREQIIRAQQENRFTRVPYDSIRPVETFWDLGFGDHTSIWFVQTIGMEFRVIDFISDHLKDLSFYVKEMRAKPYVYGTAWLPHDAKQKQFSAGGRTIEMQIEAAGFKHKIVPNLSVDDGIAAARAIFSKCVFDNDRCADGIQALKHYKFEYDEELKTFKKTPLHDWASHPADAFRMFGVAAKEEPRKKPKGDERNDYGRPSQSWMA